MASLTFSNALLPLGGTDTAEKVEATSNGFFGRLYDAMVASRRRAAEREIARLEMVYGFRIRPETETDAELATKDLPFVR